LYPLLRRREVNTFLKQCVPEYDMKDVKLERTDAIGYFYRMVRFSLLILIPSIIGFFLFERKNKGKVQKTQKKALPML